MGGRLLSGYERRKTNLELLRIVAMLMIITFHLITHCVVTQLTDAESIARLNNGWFQTPAFFRKLMALELFLPWGTAGNTIFILLAGYFLCGKSGNLQRSAKAGQKLLLQLGFATICIVLMSAVYGSWKIGENIPLVLMNVKAFNEIAWFAGYYFIVVLIGTLVMNRWIPHLDRKTYGYFLVVLFAAFSFHWSGHLAESLATGMRTLITGCFLFALGGYIRSYSPFERLRTWVLGILIVLIYAAVFVSYYNATLAKISAYQLAETAGNAFNPIILGFAGYDIVPIALGVILFEFFRRIRIPQSRLLNFISSGTFMIYLLHDNSFFYAVWQERDWITVLYLDPLMFLQMLVKWTLFLFCFGFAGYLLYLGITRLLQWSSRFILLPSSEGSDV